MCCALFMAFIVLLYVLVFLRKWSGITAGSQSIITELRARFERGDDPLGGGENDENDTSNSKPQHELEPLQDVNSVAGLLKVLVRSCSSVLNPKHVISTPIPPLFLLSYSDSTKFQSCKTVEYGYKTNARHTTRSDTCSSLTAILYSFRRHLCSRSYTSASCPRRCSPQSSSSGCTPSRSHRIARRPPLLTRSSSSKLNPPVQCPPIPSAAASLFFSSNQTESSCSVL